MYFYDTWKKSVQAIDKLRIFYYNINSLITSGGGIRSCEAAATAPLGCMVPSPAATAGRSGKSGNANQTA